MAISDATDARQATRYKWHLITFVLLVIVAVINWFQVRSHGGRVDPGPWLLLIGLAIVLVARNTANRTAHRVANTVAIVVVLGALYFLIKRL